VWSGGPKAEAVCYANNLINILYGHPPGGEAEENWIFIYIFALT